MILIAALVFVVTVLALHGVRRDVSPLRRGISRYASGRTLVPMTSAFLALAAAIGIAAWTTRSWLLGVAAAAIAGVAATPERLAPPHHSVGHTLFGFLFFVAAPIGILVSPRSSPLLVPALPALATALFFASLRVPPLTRIPGLLQRLTFATIVAWLVTAF